MQVRERVLSKQRRLTIMRHLSLVFAVSDYFHGAFHKGRKSENPKRFVVPPNSSLFEVVFASTEDPNEVAAYDDNKRE